MRTASVIVLLLSFAGFFTGRADAQESEGGFSVKADLVSGYVWRGTNYGRGPHLQPLVEFSAGGLTAGVWGSFDFSGYSEVDPYISYSFPFGLSIGFTDYYFPDQAFFETSVYDGSHAFELNTSYSAGGFSIEANCILNEAGGAGSYGHDLYFQLGYDFSNFGVFAGAGNGWHTSDTEFNLCNIGLQATKAIVITDKFSLPLTGQIILNPDREQLFVVAGISF